MDGGCRDVEFILKLGFPVFCSFTTPADIVGRWLPISFGAPIKIGDVEIHSGDYILGDRDGVIVIPHGKLDEIITTTENVIKTENKVRSAILDGLDPQEAYLKYGKF